jgi:hypothetical protein
LQPICKEKPEAKPVKWWRGRRFHQELGQEEEATKYRSLGDGPFQRVPKGQEVHLIHGPLATGEAGPPPQQNQFQTALLEHDFIIQYKKGSDMPADYLSRLPATTNEPVIATFEPFQTDLAELKREEPFAQNILYFGKHNQWPPHLSRTEANSHTDLIKKIFHDKEGILWL